MKINNKIIRLKRFVNSIVIASEAWQSQRMAYLKAGKHISLLLALTIILSLFLVAVPMAGTVEAQADYYVATTGSDTFGDGTETWVDDGDSVWSSGDTGPWLTISYALNQSKVVAGDTIKVAKGDYTITEVITVNKGVTITGNTSSPENVIVQYSLADKTQNIFTITASNVKIEGIKTISGRYAVDFSTGNPTGCTISHCILDQPGRRGIVFWTGSGTGHTVEYTTISNVGPCADPDPGPETGIMIYKSGALDLTIQHNTFTNMYSGIWLYAGNSIVINDNTFASIKDQGHPGNEYNGAPAIDLHNSGATSTANRVEVTNNTVSDCYWQGIFVYICPYTYVYNNTVYNCNYYGKDGTGDWDYAGIVVQESNDGTEHSDHCIVDSNTVYDCINGIQIWSDDCKVTNNEIYDMGNAYANEKVVGSRTYKNSGILIGSNFGNPAIDHDPTGVVIKNNNIHDNYWGLFYSADLANGVTAENNWWGDASGPSGVGLGSGNAVSDNVNFIPFLASSSPGGEVVYNVSITKSGLTSAHSGDTITYTITYKNIGTNYATNVVITEDYPSEVEYRSATPTPDNGTTDKWTIGTLAPGEGDTIYITVHIK